MKETSITAQTFNDGEIGLHFETDEGDIVMLKTTPANWRYVMQMVLHQVSVSERNPLTQTMGHA